MPALACPGKKTMKMISKYCFFFQFMCIIPSNSY